MSKKKATTGAILEGPLLNDLLQPGEAVKDELRTERDPRSVNWKNEYLDTDEGYVYELKRGGKKGKRLRKFFERLDRGGYGDEGITFWKPKIYDLAAAEAKRWKARQYYYSQMKLITPAFDLVLKNTPFSCIRLTNQFPGFAWVTFPHHEARHGESRGVSWDWWDHSYRNKNKSESPDKDEFPLKQDVGDAWFAYEDRSKVLRTRLGYFERVFDMALNYRYADMFYADRYGQLIMNLVINGRSYIIGKTRDGNGAFGVIAYPESLITKEVEPGPIRHERGRY